ncbi:MAG: dihydrolipoyl dehydrogenase [Deltaproteobacteria bacterium]|nr:dihydrolipoyl dehydrogenase [Deltaproteobacteria bacterium]
MKKYDAVILGSGPAGRHTCSELFRLNKKVCLIEMDPDSFGGVCVNKGCMPTKHLVKAAEVIETAKKAHEFGVEVPSVKPQMDQIFGEKEIFTSV